MTKTLAKLGEGGRLVIPADYRKALGVESGDELVLILEGESVRISTPREGIRRAQQIVRAHVPAGRSLSDELIADRRDETRRG